MPCFAGRYDQRIGVFVDVVLVPRHLSDTRGSVLEARDVFPGAVVRPFKGQFDTGAQTTCITRKAIDYYKMTPNGKIEIISVSGVSEVDTYIFSIGFLTGAVPGTSGAVQGSFAFFPPIIGAEIYTISTMNSKS